MPETLEGTPTADKLDALAELRALVEELEGNCSPPWKNLLDTVTAESVVGYAWTAQPSSRSPAMS
jgi:hypothetical protein